MQVQSTVPTVLASIDQEKQEVGADGKNGLDGKLLSKDGKPDGKDGKEVLLSDENSEQFQEDGRKDGKDSKNYSLSADDDQKQPPSRCPYCGGTEFWRLNSGHQWVCMKCHPPRWQKHQIEVVHVGQ
jgi:rubredoxin